jgi:shikimate 5-dehydrogenase
LNQSKIVSRKQKKVKQSKKIIKETNPKSNKIKEINKIENKNMEVNQSIPISTTTIGMYINSIKNK